MSGRAASVAVALVVSVGVHVVGFLLVSLSSSGTPAEREPQVSSPPGGQGGTIQIVKVDVLSTASPAPAPTAPKRTRPVVRKVALEPASATESTPEVLEGTSSSAEDLEGSTLPSGGDVPEAPSATGTGGETDVTSSPDGSGSSSDSTGLNQAGSAAAPADPVPSAAPVDLTGLHAALSRAAKHCYPAAAKRFRLTGSVPVEFCVKAEGGLERAVARGSSGASALDAAAVECVLPRAVPLPAPAGCYTVAIEFR